MGERIPQAEFDRVRRATCRRVAAALVRVMADTDTGLDTIAARMGKSEDDVRKRLWMLIDGKSWRGDLDFISDFAFAMAAEIDFTISRRNEQTAAVPEPAKTAGEGEP